MTDDIVTRLRDEYASCECSGINRDCDRCETEQDAAGEIERQQLVITCLQNEVIRLNKIAFKIEARNAE